MDDRPPGQNPWLALIVVCVAHFMELVDGTISHVALPTIQADLGFSESDLQWVVNSYNVAFGGLLLLGGRASDLLGRRRVFVVGMALFTVASLLNALAPSAGWLIISRGIQGLGVALVAPAGLSIVMTLFADGPARSRALGVMSAIAAGGAASGLLLGGVITEALSWQWIFYINVPIGIAVIAGAYRWVPESHAGLGHKRLDLGGALSATAGLMLLVYTIVGTLEHGFASGRTFGLFAVALASLGAFVVVEARTEAPLVRLGLLRVRSVAVGNLAMAAVTAGLAAFLYLATLYVQQVLQYQPLAAGLAFVPFAVCIAAGAAAAEPAVARLGVRLAGALALAVAAASLAVMGATLAVDGTYWWLLAGMVPMAAGISLAFVTLTLVATTNVTDDEAGVASGVLITSQQIGGAIGIAVLTTVAGNTRAGFLEALGGTPAAGDVLAASVNGYQVAFYAGAAFILLGLLLLVALRGDDVSSIDVPSPSPLDA